MKTLCAPDNLTCLSGHLFDTLTGAVTLPHVVLLCGALGAALIATLWSERT